MKRRIFLVTVTAGILFSLASMAGPLENLAHSLMYSGSRAGFYRSDDFRPLLADVQASGRFKNFSTFSYDIVTSRGSSLVYGITSLPEDASAIEHHVLF